MKTADFDYFLPPDRIAQSPARPRDSSRLMVLDRGDSSLTHTVFRRIGEFLRSGDLLVLNQTRVIPARLYARKLPGGGRAELLLLRRLSGRTWEAMVGGKGLKAGRRLEIIRPQPVSGEENAALAHEPGPIQALVLESLDGPRRIIEFSQSLDASLDEVGHVPLPPYIEKPLDNAQDYQTVYARRPGSAAAPTAGLHFTPELIAGLQAAGVHFVYVTLHIGMDTFAPVTEEDPQKHSIHSEWCRLSSETAVMVNRTRARRGRVIAVGTTAVRTLETAALHAPEGAIVAPFEGETDLYILPGFNFRAVDGMVTNFHLPRSTLLMMLSAFAGRQPILAAYQTAVEENYRFYSFGDAMLIT
ncbi:MAG: tRNA preQ1(34) S-adenosylmethionine ribosyltransferase-isomerase QueA [Anaerolineales bacterium]|nr:tRNA preQ1(34) S-adenosylmethionine ribosyltransferase-isomerase QueA [Anaerolineales bacterium]